MAFLPGTRVNGPAANAEPSSAQHYAKCVLMMSENMHLNQCMLPSLSISAFSENGGLGHNYMMGVRALLVLRV